MSMQADGTQAPSPATRIMNIVGIGAAGLVSLAIPFLSGTASAGLAGLSLGAMIYLVFRLVPVRMLNGTLVALSDEKKLADATLHAIGDGVITVDPRRKIARMNRVAQRLVGWASEEAIGRPLREVYVVHREPYVRFGSERERTILLSKDGTERIIEEVCVSVENDERETTGSIIVFRDVAERLPTEEELLRVRKLESIGILAGGIVHDVNNFLTGVLGNVSLTKLHVGKNDQALACLDAAERAAIRARDLARKLLAFEKDGKPSRQVVEILPLVKEASRFAICGPAVTCKYQAQEGIWTASLDEGQMCQVVNNIMINAVQAMGGSGNIRVDVKNATIREGRILHVKAGRYVILTIEDSGPGIPPDVLPRIFEPYYTTKADGTGLGLATCYNVMKAHGGNIFAESPPGKGAVFTLYIPVGMPTEENVPKPDKIRISGMGARRSSATSPFV